MNKDILQKQTKSMSLKKLINGKWWFFYYDLESDNSYAVKYVSSDNYLMFDIDETIKKTIVATNKDDLMKEIFSFFNDNNIQLCDLFQEE